MVNRWRRLLLPYLGFRHPLQSSLHSVQWFGAVVLKPEGLRRQHESMLVLLVRLSVTVVCYYSWVSVRLPPSSSWLVRLNGDSTWHNCNRLALGTESTRLVWGDDQSVIYFRICWPRSSKTWNRQCGQVGHASKCTFFQFGTINKKRAKRYMLWAARGIFYGHNTSTNNLTSSKHVTIRCYIFCIFRETGTCIYVAERQR